jgi:hypothetical protein
MEPFEFSRKSVKPEMGPKGIVSKFEDEVRKPFA